MHTAALDHKFTNNDGFHGLSDIDKSDSFEFLG